MTAKRNTASTPQAPLAKPIPINITPSGWVGLKLYEREIATYRRELPRLLAEGHACKYALVKGEEILGIWDQQEDAIEAGCERFGLEPIFVQKINPRDPERFALLDAYSTITP